MRVVALISGGKDSCYNMMQCVAEGHEIVALANLRPKDKDELDSYMYQTVGHHAIDYYKEAMGLPLYRRTIEGQSVEKGRDYIQNDLDEVEDLYALLKQVKEEVQVEAVSVGAILSDYQRVRVENVCLRLGLVPLAYLWRRNQTELLQEMIDCGVEAVIIKVAAMGLKPSPHLGMPISKIFPVMLNLKSKFGLNVCGEGGEFETFTLDCPLFNKKIVADEMETVIHSDDPISPVGYLNFTKMHLEEKDEAFVQQNLEDRLKNFPMKRSNRIHAELGLPNGEENGLPITSDSACEPNSKTPSLTQLPLSVEKDCQVKCSSDKLLFISEIFGLTSDSLQASTKGAMEKLRSTVEDCGMDLTDIFMMHLYVKDMGLFSSINEVYKTYFGINPPARICVETNLPENVVLQIDCLCCPAERKTMHVQGLSHWAPANIGPYSQAVQILSKVFVAGQIALCPATTKIIKGGIVAESRLSIRHVERVLSAMQASMRLSDVVLAICYVTSCESVKGAMAEWNEALKRERESADMMEKRVPDPCLQVVVVPHLPRNAMVEWQVVAAQHNTSEETTMADFGIQSVQEILPGCDFCRVDERWRFRRYSLAADPIVDCVVSNLVFTKPFAEVHREDCYKAVRRFIKYLCSPRKFQVDNPAWRIFFRTETFQYTDLLSDFCEFSQDILPPYTTVPVCGFDDKDCVISVSSVDFGQS